MPPKHMLPSFLALAEQGVRQLADPPQLLWGPVPPMWGGLSQSAALNQQSKRVCTPEGGRRVGHSPGGLHMRTWLSEAGVAASFSQEVDLGVRSGAGEAGAHCAWQRSWVREGGMPW